MVDKRSRDHTPKNHRDVDNQSGNSQVEKSDNIKNNGDNQVKNKNKKKVKVSDEKSDKSAQKVVKLPSLADLTSVKVKNPVQPTSITQTVTHKSKQDKKQKKVPENLRKTQNENTQSMNKPGSKNKNKNKHQNQVKNQPPNRSNNNMTALQQQMMEKLQGGQFRWLNEKLYTTTSREAFEFMSEAPELFTTYHEGFRVQVEKWPTNPVDVFIKFLQGNPKLVVGDFGCGDAKIAEVVKNKVHSFDLVAVNERVTACDMKNVPLKNDTLDVAIFSLSLMGVNFMSFIQEAHRTLKMKGQLKIAEVRSRFDEQHGGIETFIKAVEEMGFQLKNMEKNNKMFVMFDFVKNKAVKPQNKHADGTLLKPCIYKRR